MDGTTYIGENSDRLDQFGPIKINLIGRWSAIDLVIKYYMHFHL